MIMLIMKILLGGHGTNNTDDSAYKYHLINKIILLGGHGTNNTDDTAYKCHLINKIILLGGHGTPPWLASPPHSCCARYGRRLSQILRD